MPFEGFKYKIDGRSVSQDEWMTHMAERAITQRIARVSDLRCPLHNETPKRDGNQLRFCCSRLQQMATDAMRG